MKLSFNTWVYSSFPVWVPAYPLAHAIERLASIGYEGIEIGAASPHAFPDYVDAAARREIRNCLNTNGLALAAMLPAPGGGPGYNVASSIGAERVAALDQYKKVVALCSDLGGDTVIYVAGWHTFGTSREQAWAWSREALVELAGYASGKGITLVIEPTSADSNLVDSCDDALQLMQEVGRPNVKVMFDTYHVLYRNEVSTDYVTRMGTSLRHVHLADANRATPSDAGRADYRGIIQALKQSNYSGYLSLEIGFDRRAVEPDRIARDAYTYLKRIMSEEERSR